MSANGPDKFVMLTLLKIKCIDENNLRQQAMLCNVLDQMMDDDMDTVVECTEYLEDQFRRLEKLYYRKQKIS